MRSARRSATASRKTTSISALLREAGIESLDAEVLLSFVLRKPRTWLLAHGEEPLSLKQQQRFEPLVERRKQHEPLAYITGEKEFYGRKFLVDRRVMIPRPSTEVLVDEVKKLYDSLSRENRVPFIDKWYRSHIVPADNEIVIFTHFFPKKLTPTTYNLSQDGTNPPPLIVDIGTGSGCIGITLALEFPELRVICTDISEDALDVARENAKRFGILDRVSFHHASLFPVLETGNRPFEALNGKPENFLVVSNPPYIPYTREPSAHGTGPSPLGTPLPPDVIDFEPHEALFAGPAGMDVLKPLWDQCQETSQCCGCIFECRQEQAKKLTQQL